MKSKIAGLLLAGLIAAGGLGLAACSSDNSGSDTPSVSDQVQQAQDAVDSATQQGGDAVDQANQALNDAKDAINSVQGGGN